MSDNPKNDELIRRMDAKQFLISISPDLDAETVQRCIEAINKVPAVDNIHPYNPSEEDLVPVVRCKDCKLVSRCYSTMEMVNCTGERFTKYVQYCSLGRRKEQSNDGTGKHD